MRILTTILLLLVLLQGAYLALLIKRKDISQETILSEQLKMTLILEDINAELAKIRKDL